MAVWCTEIENKEIRELKETQSIVIGIYCNVYKILNEFNDENRNEKN